MALPNTVVPVTDLTGTRVLITGANSGIGFGLAQRFAAAGAEVLLAVRRLDRGRDAMRRIAAVTPRAKLRVVRLDLASLESVAELSTELVKEGRPLEILVNNAGVMAPPQRRSTEDGFELQMGTNHLGHFALTARLLPLLTSAGRARVVSISSVHWRMTRTSLTDLNPARYDRHGQYSRSKLAQLVFALELNRRSRAGRWGIASMAAHPGSTITNLQISGPGPDDPLMRFNRMLSGVPLLCQQVEGGVLPPLYAATSPAACGGVFYGPAGMLEMTRGVRVAKIPASARDEEVGRRLWERSEELTSTRFPARDGMSPAAGN